MGRRVEIGTLRERVEIIDEPGCGPGGRVGRIRHANGENAAIDAATLQHLMDRAQAAPEPTPSCGGRTGRLVA